MGVWVSLLDFSLKVFLLLMVIVDGVVVAAAKNGAITDDLFRSFQQNRILL